MTHILFSSKIDTHLFYVFNKMTLQSLFFLIDINPHIFNKWYFYRVFYDVTLTSLYFIFIIVFFKKIFIKKFLNF